MCRVPGDRGQRALGAAVRLGVLPPLRPGGHHLVALRLPLSPLPLLFSYHFLHLHHTPQSRDDRGAGVRAAVLEAQELLPVALWQVHHCTVRSLLPLERL